MLGRNLYCEGVEALEQVALRCCRPSISGGVQEQVGWGSEEHSLVEGVSAWGTGVGAR